MDENQIDMLEKLFTPENVENLIVTLQTIKNVDTLDVKQGWKDVQTIKTKLQEVQTIQDDYQQIKIDAENYCRLSIGLLGIIIILLFVIIVQNFRGKRK